jgi:hypothetical protein
MRRAKAALEAIRHHPELAGKILASAVEKGGAGFLEGLGYYLVAVQDGFIIDPQQFTEGPASALRPRPGRRAHRPAAPTAASPARKRVRPKPR